MESNFKAVSISYKTAPLKIREQLTLAESVAKQMMLSLREITNTNELLVLSTCNRTEVYYSSDKNYSNEIIKLICLQKGIGEFEKFAHYFIDINEHHEALQHLYDVAIGLESQVVGDIQIINQVKQAYQWSADLSL